MADNGGGYEFGLKECWAHNCTKPPEGLIVSPSRTTREVCQEHGEEYVRDGKWERYEDLRGWADDGRPDSERGD